jgi:hypothetical protein
MSQIYQMPLKITNLCQILNQFFCRKLGTVNKKFANCIDADANSLWGIAVCDEILRNATCQVLDNIRWNQIVTSLRGVQQDSSDFTLFRLDILLQEGVKAQCL